MSATDAFMRAPTDPEGRRLDPVAVHAALRRFLRAPQAPWLHGEVARRMAEKLELILHKPQHIIDWWSSLGASSALLSKAYPKAGRVMIEPDAAWQARSRKEARRPWWTTQSWTHGAIDVRLESNEIAPGAGLIWANMMLHAAVDPPALIQRWHALLKVDGFVMFSCLGPGTLRELRALYARLGWPSPTPGFVDMHDLGDMLVAAGFADPVMDQETLTLQWDNSRALLNELRTLGGNLAPDRVRGLRTPRWRACLERELESLANAQGKLSMSIEVAYGHAFKTAPKLKVSASTTVSLEDMRAMVRTSHGRDETPESLR